MALWQVDLYPLDGQPDLAAEQVAHEAAELGLGEVRVRAARGFLIQTGGESAALDLDAARRIARELLCDAATGGGSTGRRWRTWTATSWPSRWRRGPGAARGDSAADERMDDLPEVVPRHGVRRTAGSSQLAACRDVD